MVKKRINKRLVKTKSLDFKIPESFSALSFNQKIISIVLLVLIIGIVASLFPGNVTTGMAANPIQQPIELLKGTLSGVNDLITTIFGAFFPGEKTPIQIYARFILFSIVICIVYFVMKMAGSQNSFLNILIGIGIAYLATFFIPASAILGTGILYSATFLSILTMIPLVFLFIIYFKFPKTKGGYLLRSALCLVMLILTNAGVGFTEASQDINKPVGSAMGYSLSIVINYIATIGMLFVIVLLFFSVWKFVTVKYSESQEAMAINMGAPVLEGTIYKWIGKVAQKLNKKS